MQCLSEHPRGPLSLPTSPPSPALSVITGPLVDRTRAPSRDSVRPALHVTPSSPHQRRPHIWSTVSTRPKPDIMDTPSRHLEVERWCGADRQQRAGARRLGGVEQTPAMAATWYYFVDADAAQRRKTPSPACRDEVAMPARTRRDATACPFDSIGIRIDRQASVMIVLVHLTYREGWLLSRTTSTQPLDALSYSRRSTRSSRGRRHTTFG